MPESTGAVPGEHDPCARPASRALHSTVCDNPMNAIPGRALPDTELQSRALAGERLSRADAEALLSLPLNELGRLAFARKRAVYGDVATYVINKQVNPTNLCVFTCKFCDFAARPGDAHAYSLTEEQILAGLSEDLAEVHIVGGLWRTWDLERSARLVEQ